MVKKRGGVRDHPNYWATRSMAWKARLAQINRTLHLRAIEKPTFASLIFYRAIEKAALPIIAKEVEMGDPLSPVWFKVKTEWRGEPLYIHPLYHQDFIAWRNMLSRDKRRGLVKDLDLQYLEVLAKDTAEVWAEIELYKILNQRVRLVEKWTSKTYKPPKKGR